MHQISILLLRCSDPAHVCRYMVNRNLWIGNSVVANLKRHSGIHAGSTFGRLCTLLLLKQQDQHNLYEGHHTSCMQVEGGFGDLN